MTKFNSLKPSEKAIMNSIIDWMNFSGFFAFHIHGTEQYRNSVRMAGLPDIIGNAPDGKAVYIEVKNHKGKVTPEQEAFIMTARKSGCHAIIARSLEEVVKYFNNKT